MAQHGALVALEPRRFHFRESRGLEINLLMAGATEMLLLEARSGATVDGSMLRPLHRMSALVEDSSEHRAPARMLVYGGEERQRRRDSRVVPWSALDRVRWPNRALDPRPRPP